MKRTAFVLNFPAKFAINYPHKSKRKFSFSLGLVFLFYSRRQKTNDLWGSIISYVIQILSPKLFFFPLKATVTAELFVAISKDGN